MPAVTARPWLDFFQGWLFTLPVLCLHFLQLPDHLFFHWLNAAGILYRLASIFGCKDFFLQKFCKLSLKNWGVTNVCNMS